MVALKTMSGLPGGSRGFTLLELLVVIGIIVALTALTLPALKIAGAGTALTSAGQTVADQFGLARQEAAGENREVQVRFVWVDESPAGYKALQLWAPAVDNVTIYRPIGKMVPLAKGTLISSNSALSPLIDAATIPEKNEDFPGRGMTKYRGFRFRPGGATDLTFNSTSNFLTILLHKDSEATSKPDNYVVIQVDPVSGRTKTYRP